MKALVILIAVFLLSITSLPASALSPGTISVTDYIKIMKIIVRVTPGDDGKARYWWMKMKLLSVDGLTESLVCGKYDMSTVTNQAMMGDENLLNYLSRNYSNEPMTETDKAWCLQ